MSFFLLLNTKEDILKNTGSQRDVDYHSMNKKYYGSQWGPGTV